MNSTGNDAAFFLFPFLLNSNVNREVLTTGNWLLFTALPTHDIHTG